MANVSFKKGTLARLPQEKVVGTLYVTTDERAIYLDVDSNTRIRIGDFQEFASLEALQKNTNPSTSALYYVADINCLAKWDGSKYAQINTDTGATDIEVVGDGNAVTAATYNATTRKITLTKGASYVTANDVELKLTEKIGNLGDDYSTVKDYVDAKTEGVVSDEAMQQLSGRVDELEKVKHTHTNQTELDKIETGDKKKWDDAVTDVAELKEDYEELDEKLDTKQDTVAFEGDYNPTSNKAATMADVTSAVGGLAGAMHWRGAKSSVPTGDENGTYAAGDVISVNNVEYAFDGKDWLELGNESSHHTHENINTLNKITDTKVSNWDDAYTKAHEHSNKGELDKIKSGDTDKWNTAATDVADIKEDYLTSEDKATLEGEIEKKQDKIAANTYDTYGSASAAESAANAYTDAALTWGDF